MNGKKSLLALAMVSALLAFNDPFPVSSQQAPPCATSTANGKTEKQMHLDDCSCEQTGATDKPTYRVGAAPFGHKAALRVGTNSRRGQEVVAAKDLYGGLAMPKLSDLRSPKIAGLKERLLRDREARRQAVQTAWQNLERDIEFEPENYFANKKLKQRSFVKAHERFLEFQRSDEWVSWPKFDWRERGIDVGPVLNQGACNSCWAFVAMSVYQSSWNVEEMRLGREFFDELYDHTDYVYQRVPSVQQLLNCLSKEQGDCEGGGWHGTAFAFMVNSHVPHIPDRLVWNKGDKMRIEEYTGRKSRCTDILRMSKVKRGGMQVVTLDGPDSRPRLPKGSDHIGTAFDRALAWGYVNEKPDELPSVKQLKAALIEHGPLAVPIHGDSCFSVYQSGVFNGPHNGGPTHVVVLIGWDDDKQAWLIKNSWGEAWGENGYGWVAYGSNNIGLFAAWIQPSPSTEEQ
jgi:C1A family cysteine protease